MLETRYIPNKKNDLAVAAEGLKKAKRRQSKGSIFGFIVGAIFLGCFTWAFATLVQEFKALMITIIITLCIIFVFIIIAAFMMGKEHGKSIDRLLSLNYS